MSERRCCSVANSGCKAPAGYANNYGWANGSGSCRGTCVDCLEPVCSEVICSRRLARGRVCFFCAGEPEEWCREHPNDRRERLRQRALSVAAGLLAGPEAKS